MARTTMIRLGSGRKFTGCCHEPPAAREEAVPEPRRERQLPSVTSRDSVSGLVELG